MAAWVSHTHTQLHTHVKLHVRATDWRLHLSRSVSVFRFNLCHSENLVADREMRRFTCMFVCYLHTIKFSETDPCKCEQRHGRPPRPYDSYSPQKCNSAFYLVPSCPCPPPGDDDLHRSRRRRRRHLTSLQSAGEMERSYLDLRRDPSEPPVTQKLTSPAFPPRSTFDPAPAPVSSNQAWCRGWPLNRGHGRCRRSREVIRIGGWPRDHLDMTFRRPLNDLALTFMWPGLVPELTGGEAEEQDPRWDWIHTHTHTHTHTHKLINSLTHTLTHTHTHTHPNNNKKSSYALIVCLHLKHVALFSMHLTLAIFVVYEEWVKLAIMSALNLF